jgi:hypothetical protein
MVAITASWLDSGALSWNSSQSRVLEKNRFPAIRSSRIRQLYLQKFLTCGGPPSPTPAVE